MLAGPVITPHAPDSEIGPGRQEAQPGNSESLPQGSREEVHFPHWGVQHYCLPGRQNLSAGENDTQDKQAQMRGKQKRCDGSYWQSWRPWFQSLRVPELGSLSFNKYLHGYKLVRLGFCQLQEYPCPVLGSSVRHTAGKISEGQIEEDFLMPHKECWSLHYRCSNG